MTIFGKHILHKWADIQTMKIVTFMDSKYCDYQSTRYRICEECKKIQEFNFDSQGGWWWTIPKKQQEIFKSHLYKENGRWVLDEKAGIPPDFDLEKCKDKE